MINERIVRVLDEIIAVGAKQVGVLYHHTSYAKGLAILRDNKIIASSGEAGSRGGYISTTRSKYFLKGGGYGLGGVGVILVLDGNKLSNRYEIVPWKYSAGEDASETGDEDEERIIGISSIPNIKSYIIEVRVYETFIDPHGKDYDIVSQRFMGGKSWSVSDFKTKVEEHGLKCSVIPEGRIW